MLLTFVNESLQTPNVNAKCKFSSEPIVVNGLLLIQNKFTAFLITAIHSHKYQK